jgi:hypothetical protein
MHIFNFLNRHFCCFFIALSLTPACALAQTVAWQNFITAPTPYFNASSLGCGMDLNRQQAAAIGPDGNIVVTGCANGTIATIDTNTSYFDMFTAKINAQTGTELWGVTAGSNVRNAGFSVAIDSAGDVLLAGLRDGVRTLSKLHGATGALIWARPLTTPTPASGENQISMVLDRDNNVILTSDTEIERRRNTFTAKLRGSDGTTIWQNNFKLAGANAYASINAKTSIDRFGNPFVAVICYCDDGAQVFVQKLSALDGTTIWRAQSDASVDSINSISGLALDSLGNAFVAGFTDVDNNSVAFLAKFSGNSMQAIWKTYNTDNTITQSAHTAIALLPSGDIVATGYAANATKRVIRTARYSSSTGAQIWRRDLTNGVLSNDEDSIEGRAIAVDASGDIIVTGKQVLADDNESMLASTAKYDQNGTLFWLRNFDSAYKGAGQLLLLTSDKQVIEFGTHFIGTRTIALTTIRRMNENGQPIWSVTSPAARDAIALPGSKRLDGSGISLGFNDKLPAISPSAIDGQGNIIVTGNITGANGQRQLMTVKTNGNSGRELWRATHPSGVNSNNSNTGNTVALDTVGDVFVAAGSSVPEGLLYAKYKGTDGTVIWSFIAAESQSTGVFGSTGIAVDFQNNLLGAGGNSVYKINGTTGKKLWASIFSRQGSTNIGAQSIAIDHFGDINVGFRDSDGKFMVAKFNGSNGQEIWHKVIATDGTLSASAIVVAVDKNGDIAAVTNSIDLGVGQVIQVVKLARADGNTLWTAVYDGSFGNYGTTSGASNTIDKPNNIKIDSLGNIVITGFSSEIGEGYSMRTIKFAGTDGRIMWNKGVVTSSGGIGYGLVISANDDVITTGRCTTVKYRADGRTLWLYASNVANRDCYNQSVHDFQGATYVTGLAGNNDLRATWSSAKLTETTPSIDTAMTLTSSANPPSYGIPFTVTLRLTNGSPTGLVRFKVDNLTNSACSALVPVNRIASCTLTPFAGRRMITAEYSGDSAHMGATQTLELVVKSEAEKIVVQATDFDRNGAADLLLTTPTGFSIWAPTVRPNPSYLLGSDANLPNVGAGFKPIAVGMLGQNRDSAIVWRNDEGGLIITRMSGMRVSETRNYGTYFDYAVAAFADLDGDGYDDVLWRQNSTGNLYVWFMDANANVAQVSAWGGADNTWTVSGVGDLNGDGNADIIWRHASGAIYSYLSIANRRFTVNYIGEVDSSWTIRKIADFDGDGRADLLWTQPQSGVVAVWKMDGIKVQRVVVLTDIGNAATIIAFADLNGDGRMDIITHGSTANKNNVYQIAANWSGTSYALQDLTSGKRVLQLLN